MNKRKAVLITVAGTIAILLAALLLARLAYRDIYATAAGMALLLCGVVLAATLRRLLLWLAPDFVAERRLERSIRAGATAYAAHFDGDAEDGGPSICFHGRIQGHEGLRVLVLAGIAPQAAIEEAAGGIELQLTLFDSLGRRQIGFQGVLEVSPAGARFLVRQVELPGRAKGYPIS